MRSSADSRRRRLIAVEGDSDTSIEAQRQAVSTEPSRGALVALTGRDRLLRRAVSAQRWKHTLFIMGLLIITSALVTSEVRPPADDVLSQVLERSRTAWCCLLLAAAGQLCLLISWLRSCSDVDFDGRYKSWRALAIVLLAVAGLAFTDSTTLLSQWIALSLQPLLGTVRTAIPAIILVPVAGTLTALTVRLWPELQRQKLTALFWVLGGIHAVRAVLPAHLIPPAIESVWWSQAVALQWAAVFVFSAVLLQTRYVMHINADPPIRKRPTNSGQTAAANSPARGDSRDASSSDPPRVTDSSAERQISEAASGSESGDALRTDESLEESTSTQAAPSKSVSSGEVLEAEPKAT